MRPFCPALLTLALWMICAAARGDELRGDFNDNGGVDLVDFSLFVDAFGSVDSRFDLNGSGRVDFADLFLFADRFGEGTTPEVEGVADEMLPPPYRILKDGRRIRIFLPAYSIAIQGTSPFGIVSLRLNGQAPDFAHPELPLGDWEWFWYRQAGTDDQWLAAKLLQQDWGEPEIVETSDRILVRYRLNSATEAGADLAVTYRLPLVGSRFGIDYAVVNGTQSRFEKPYLMLGFPGFSNQGFVEEVADAVATRPVSPPHASFQQEANHQSGAEIILLRHDVDPAGADGGSLEGTIKLRFGTNIYRLTTTFTPDPQSFWVYSAHTNKPLYLTSHLYAYLHSLGSGVRTELGVEYELARE